MGERDSSRKILAFIPLPQFLCLHPRIQDKFKSDRASKSSTTQQTTFSPCEYAGKKCPTWRGKFLSQTGQVMRAIITGSVIEFHEFHAGTAQGIDDCHAGFCP
jgi:hypothetical protein